MFLNPNRRLNNVQKNNYDKSNRVKEDEIMHTICL